MGLSIGTKYDARMAVWEIIKNTNGARSVRAKFTTSGKNKDGEWETDFNGYVNFKGEAARMMRERYNDNEDITFNPAPLRIQISSGSVYQTKSQKKDANGNPLTSRDGKPYYTYYTNVDVFEFKFIDNNAVSGNSGATSTRTDSSFVNIPDSVIDEELPFA